MITREQLEKLAEENPAKRFYVHDGYFGWSYGSPQVPTLISQETALALLNHIAARRGIDCLAAVTSVVPPLQYAGEGTDLYERTGENRFIVFAEERECIIEDKDKARNEHTFDIGGAA